MNWNNIKIDIGVNNLKMNELIDSDISFSLASKQISLQPTVMYVEIEISPKDQSRKSTITHLANEYKEKPIEKQKFTLEQKFLRQKIKTVIVESDVPWPVTSEALNYKWFFFRDKSDRFYSFLFLSRINRKILIKLYEKIKNLANHYSNEPRKMSPRLASMITEFNDFNYKESFSDFMRNSNFAVSCEDEASKKETCYTENVTIPSNKVKKIDAIKFKYEFYCQRERRLMIIWMIFGFALSLAIMISVIEHFLDIRKSQLHYQ